MDQYITKSRIFGLQQQISSVMEEFKSGIVMPNNKNNSFNSYDMGPKTHSDSDLVEDVIKHFHNKNIRMEKLSIIRDYFYYFPDIAELSMNVTDMVKSKFDSETQLSLEMHGERNSESEYIALCIRMSSYDDSVMERIRNIREEYAESLTEMNGWFLLTTDFMPPR